MKNKPHYKGKYDPKHPQSVLDPNRQATLQFLTKAERDLWEEWYRHSGCSHFSCFMMQCGPKWWKTKKGLHWRKVAEDRLDNWPFNNEVFVYEPKGKNR